MTRGPREPKKGLRFNEAVHRYWLDGNPVPGATTILNVLSKDALPKWAAESVAAYVIDNPDLIDDLRAMGRQSAVNALKGIPWGVKTAAAERGKLLHAHAEALLRDEEVDVAPEHVGAVGGALDFLDEWSIEPILIEFACASREHHYAGTGDLIAKYVRPDTGETGTAIFDWKSGRKIYPEIAWQLAAYSHAEFYGLDGDEHQLPETTAAFGVHITDEGYEVSEARHGPDIYEEFLAIRRVHEIAKRGRGDWRKPGSGHLSGPITNEETP